MAVAAALTPTQQRSFYEDQGYLVFPEFLTRDELTSLRTALAETLTEAEGLTESTTKFSISRSDDGARYHVRRLFNPIAHHQAFRDLVSHPRILDIVENLIGPDIQLHHTKLNLKPPSTSTARFEWHQDWPFFPHTNYDLLAVAVFLDDATEENGCLTIIPGSHKHGPQIHAFAREGAFTSKLANASAVSDPSRHLSVPVPAGGLELHHCNMLHSSKANIGDRPRSAMIIQYRAADAIQLGGVTTHAGWGMTVRGKNPLKVRMIEGVFNMPGEILNPMQRDG